MSDLKLKTSGDGDQRRVKRGYMNKDNIYIKMERELNLPAPYQYEIECSGCLYGCRFGFDSPIRLSYASVGKLASVFSLPCRKLAKVMEVQQDHAGLLSLLSNAEGNSVCGQE